MAISIGYGGTPPLLLAQNGTQSLTVSTTGAVIRASSSNTQVASISPASGSGPSHSFTITAQGVGNAVITFTDDVGGSASLPVSVLGFLDLVNVTPGAGPQPYAVLQATELNYKGPLTPACIPANAGIIYGGTPLFEEAGTGPSQNGPGPVTWIVLPLLGNTSVEIEVFDVAGNSATITLPFVASSALGNYAMTFLDFLGLSGVAAGFKWTITLAGLPPGSPVAPIDAGYTGLGGVVLTNVLLANTYYTITFEGNGAPPTPVTFLTGAPNSNTQTIQIEDYAPPMRGISTFGYAFELLEALPNGWFSEDAMSPGGGPNGAGPGQPSPGLIYAVEYGQSGALWWNDRNAEILRLSNREQTAAGDDLVAWGADFFPPYVPMGKLPGESDASYRTMLEAMLPGNVATIANIQAVAQVYENRLNVGALVQVFDNRSNPGGGAQLGLVTGQFVLLVWYPDVSDDLSLFCDFGFLDFAYAGNCRDTDFFADWDYADWNYSLPPQDSAPVMPAWDTTLDGIVRSRKSGGRAVVYSMYYP